MIDYYIIKTNRVKLVENIIKKEFSFQLYFNF